MILNLEKSACYGLFLIISSLAKLLDTIKKRSEPMIVTKSILRKSISQLQRPVGTLRKYFVAGAKRYRNPPIGHFTAAEVSWNPSENTLQQEQSVVGALR